ncbi:hypothetical protein HELRODRAFT_162893 [Helobdella robusta]|uniref:Uncharacterized protein n=1 Tax=Helobdella robusta TaxID=6412 RepID=T1ETB9_HELRO|nr:hypothetical protein HELRODRAFT_162893 [Helobdella robusta]ESN99360.1 hypothetical protein HELRODRAFT_162893 [Helobdella robusta]
MGLQDEILTLYEEILATTRNIPNCDTKIKEGIFIRLQLGQLMLDEKFSKTMDKDIFVRLQIGQLMLDEKFSKTMDQCEFAAWDAFKKVCQEFLEKHKASNYANLVDGLIASYQQLGCNMFLKLHFLHSFFSANGDVSDEYGKRSHQTIATMEHIYKGKWSPAMLADFCWNLKHDEPDAAYRRQTKYKIKYK